MIVLSQNSHQPAGHDPSQIRPSAPARPSATRQNDTFCLIAEGRLEKPQLLQNVALHLFLFRDAVFLSG